MLEWIVAGLAFGTLGSVHCIGMCGPIALSLPGAQRDRGRFVLERLVYNLGRAVTYTLLGALAGGVGTALSLAGVQQILSVAVGVGMVAIAGVPWVRRQAQRVEQAPSAFLQRVMAPLGSLYERGGVAAMGAVGLLNGLLPCGFVYAALATAVTAGSVSASMGFMAAFGLGTLPAMLGVSFLGRLADASWRARLHRFAPYGLALVGLLLILRGLGLGGMISPALPETIGGVVSP